MKKRTKSIELLRLEGIWDESYQKMTNKKAINSPKESVKKLLFALNGKSINVVRLGDQNYYIFTLTKTGRSLLWKDSVLAKF